MKDNSIKEPVLLDSSYIAKRCKAILRRQLLLEKKPATNVQLAAIWPAWNALPGGLLPEDKCKILTLEDREFVRDRFGHAEHAKKLRETFPSLPLDKHKYNQALNEACRWAKLIDFYSTTIGLHKELIAKNWAFADADNHAIGRVAISRAAAEIKLTHPGLLDCTAPTLEDIKLLASNYDAYTEARDEALEALNKLVFKIPEMRTGKELPLNERALGVPNPPTDTPRYLFIARLEALGICSRKRLRHFMRYEFHRLTWQQKLQFKKMQGKPKYGKNPYAGFLVWVIDNRRIFENAAFGWQWKDILEMAEKKGVECPGAHLKQWAYQHRIRIKVRPGGAFGYPKAIMSSESLLTPAPIFGDALKKSGA